MFTRFEMYSVLLAKVNEIRYEHGMLNHEIDDFCNHIKSLTYLTQNVETVGDKFNLKWHGENIILLNNIIKENFKLAESSVYFTKMSKGLKALKNVLEFNPKDESESEYTYKNLLYRYMKAVSLYSEDIYFQYKETVYNLISFFKIDKSTFKHPNYIRHYNNYDIAFFSYSYDDKLYSFGFFIFFLNKRILLYVDWMFNKVNLSIEDLKSDLDLVMRNCDYFFFLRSMNSELSLRGNRQIRQWCSWEIGNFYQYSRQFNKYYIETFELSGSENSLLANFKPLDMSTF